MEHNKKINRAGGISIPVSLRREYGIEAGTKFNVSVSPSTGNIILKKIEGLCFFCGESDRLTVYKGRHICEECALNIYDGAVNNVDND